MRFERAARGTKLAHKLAINLLSFGALALIEVV